MVYQAIIEPPQLTLFNSVLDWVVATKAYNLSDLLDVVLDDSVFYKKKFLDIGNGRIGAFRNKTWRI